MMLLIYLLNVVSVLGGECLECEGGMGMMMPRQSIFTRGPYGQSGMPGFNSFGSNYNMNNGMRGMRDMYSRGMSTGGGISSGDMSTGGITAGGMSTGMSGMDRIGEFGGMSSVNGMNGTSEIGMNTTNGMSGMGGTSDIKGNYGIGFDGKPDYGRFQDFNLGRIDTSNPGIRNRYEEAPLAESLKDGIKKIGSDIRQSGKRLGQKALQKAQDIVQDFSQLRRIDEFRSFGLHHHECQGLTPEDILNAPSSFFRVMGRQCFQDLSPDALGAIPAMFLPRIRWWRDATPEQVSAILPEAILHVPFKRLGKKPYLNVGSTGEDAIEESAFGGHPCLGVTEEQEEMLIRDRKLWREYTKRCKCRQPSWTRWIPICLFILLLLSLLFILFYSFASY